MRDNVGFAEVLGEGRVVPQQVLHVVHKRRNLIAASFSKFTMDEKKEKQQQQSLLMDQKEIPFARNLVRGLLLTLNGGAKANEIDMEEMRLPLDKLPEGPWKADHELHPNDEYRFKASGYRCRIARPPHDWVWNGYVSLPDGHPDLGKHYNDLQEAIDVHGGLTYARGHTYGFDTQACGDIAPGLLAMGMPYQKNAMYWTFEMVLAEVKELAAQFKARAK